MTDSVCLLFRVACVLAAADGLLVAQGPVRQTGPTAGGGELGGVGKGLGFFEGELFGGEGLGGGRLQGGGQLEVLHVDAVGQAEEARAHAGAIERCMVRADLDFAVGIAGVVQDRALGGVDRAFQLLGNPHAACDDQLVALVGEPAPGAETLGVIESAIFTLFGMGLPAFIALDDAGDGRLVDAEGGSDPGLGFAFEFDPLVDEVGVAVGLSSGRKCLVFRVWCLVGKWTSAYSWQ